MLRAVGSVVGGYAVIFVTIFVTFSVAFIILGVDGAYEPGTYEVSLMWITVTLVLGIIAALIGGIVSALIAKGPTPPRVLAGLVLVLGLLSAGFIALSADPDEPAKVRTEEVSIPEAVRQSEQPLWVALANPFIGTCGVLVGASLVGGRARAALKPADPPPPPPDDAA